MIHSIDHNEHPEFTDYIEIPLTAEEMAMVKRAASERGLSPLLWARNLVRRTADLLGGPADDPALRDGPATPRIDATSGDLVEWNPVGDQWLLANVVTRDGGHVSIKLRENGQILAVEDRHLRPALREGSGQ